LYIGKSESSIPQTIINPVLFPLPDRRKPDTYSTNNSCLAGIPFLRVEIRDAGSITLSSRAREKGC
jgi:hypothetical protein